MQDNFDSYPCNQDFPPTPENSRLSSSLEILGRDYLRNNIPENLLNHSQLNRFASLYEQSWDSFIFLIQSNQLRDARCKEQKCKKFITDFNSLILILTRQEGYS